ncbi:hypothetical protein [Microbacterium suwonense]|uniref:Uncharacterized protein n=1 Tax=Microbacterium suwonense TaxID=683047 RepID=A0ABN6X244_9MICO|nr:hypothetical protein GCM10025863_13780 [Microbacterium suwonense]
MTAYDVPVADFALRRIELSGQQRLQVAGPAMVLATAGDVAVTGAAGRATRIRVGTAVFATADETELVLRGTGEVFLAEPGRN